MHLMVPPILGEQREDFFFFFYFPPKSFLILTPFHLLFRFSSFDPLFEAFHAIISTLF